MWVKTHCYLSEHPRHFPHIDRDLSFTIFLSACSHVSVYTCSKFTWEYRYLFEAVDLCVQLFWWPSAAQYSLCCQVWRYKGLRTVVLRIPVLRVVWQLGACISKRISAPVLNDSLRTEFWYNIFLQNISTYLPVKTVSLIGRHIFTAFPNWYINSSSKHRFNLG